MKNSFFFPFSFGRLTRSEFLAFLMGWQSIVYILYMFFLFVLLSIFGDEPFLLFVYLTATYGLTSFIFLSASVRRLKDMGHSTIVNAAISSISLVSLYFMALPFFDVLSILLPPDYLFSFTRGEMFITAEVSAVIFALCFLYLLFRPSSAKEFE